MRRTVLSAGLAAGLLCLAACGSGEEASNPESGGAAEDIRIAVSNAMTGSAAAGTKPVADGLTAWIEHVNDEGGVNGRNIDLNVQDDAFNATQAVANARQFVTDDVFAVLGGAGTPTQLAIAPLLTDAGIPFFMPYAGVRPLLEPPKDNIFSITPLYEDEVRALIPYALEEFGDGSVYVVAQRELGPDDSIAAAKETAEDAGVDYAGDSIFNLGAPDLSALALQVKAAAPDYVILLTTAPEGSRVIKALAAQDALPGKKILGMPTSTANALSATVGEQIGEDYVALIPNRPVTDPAAEECIAAFEAASEPVQADVTSLYGCAMGQAFVHALEALGDDITREAFMAEVNSWDEEEASPLLSPLTFTAEDRMGLSGMFIVTSRGADGFETTDTVPVG
jgi:branched-chain amino acid transport system substrate-binding protein